MHANKETNQTYHPPQLKNGEDRLREIRKDPSDHHGDLTRQSFNSKTKEIELGGNKKSDGRLITPPPLSRLQPLTSDY
jgi:hypothetical protein